MPRPRLDWSRQGRARQAPHGASLTEEMASAGVSRIVAPRAMDSADAVASAAVLGIEYRAVPDSDARAARRLVLGRQGEDVAVVRARREERKRLKQERQLGRKAIRQAAAASRGS